MLYYVMYKVGNEWRESGPHVTRDEAIRVEAEFAAQNTPTYIDEREEG